MTSFVGLHPGHGRASSQSCRDMQHSTAQLLWHHSHYGWNCSFPEAGNCCWCPGGSQEAAVPATLPGAPQQGSLKPWHVVPLSTQRGQHHQQAQYGLPHRPGCGAGRASSSRSPGTKRSLCSGAGGVPRQTSCFMGALGAARLLQGSSPCWCLSRP